MKPKRKTWRDRRCFHGKAPDYRVQLDLAHCKRPGCLDAVLAKVGLQRIPAAEKTGDRQADALIAEGRVLRDQRGKLEHAAIHHWFGLTYASYLVLPRTLLQYMPAEWQRRFVGMLEELEAVFERSTPKDAGYEVQLRDQHTGLFVYDPLRNYRHPDPALIDSYKRSRGAA
jgi:hypothetical protein